ncbi:MAG: RluA family pseudouridine synthase [Patescibacteria group bacterium]
MEIPILYEDEHSVVINKPAGIVAHSDGKTKEESVSDWVALHYPNTESVGEPTILSNGEKIIRPGIVHRLDRETSGAILIAKTKEGFDYLKQQFKDRKIEKIYHLFVYGKIKREDGTINLPIGRSKKDFRMRSAEEGARGELREALTYYRVLKRSDSFSFVEARPKTGRTHQIRVHFKALGYPVVSDKLYAKNRESGLGFKRLALHAFSLSFTSLGGKRITANAPYPEDFKAAISFF